ncbi:MAG: hypothetical protein OEW67_13500 [Cyclobacteriaceae bacterium]|nr:hypothetical protein [Cyclobacteriaceae bacterium]
MIKANLFTIALSSIVFLLGVSCIEDNTLEIGSVEGYKPVYAESYQTEILFQAPRAMESPGKIYVFGNYLFVNEMQNGVHVINNSDPSNPINTAFIQIPGNVDIAVRDYVLYADNYTDLVAIDVSDMNNPLVCDREVNVFSIQRDYPDMFGVYFECVDKSKGVVTGWIPATIVNPKCSR